MPDAEGFLTWTARQMPDAHGYWPAQAVATHALTGHAVIDTAVASSLGNLPGPAAGTRNSSATSASTRPSFPRVAPTGQGAGELRPRRHAQPGRLERRRRGSRRRHHRRLLRPDRGRRRPGRGCAGHLRRHPHRVGGDRLLGRGAGTVDGAPYRAGRGAHRRTEQRRRPLRRLGPVDAPRIPAPAGPDPPRSGDPGGCRSGCPTSVANGCRSTTRHSGPACSTSTSPTGPPACPGPPTRPVASSCAASSSASGSPARRVVASGGGTKVAALDGGDGRHRPACRSTRWPCPKGPRSVRPTWPAWRPGSSPRSTARWPGPGPGPGSSPTRPGTRRLGRASERFVALGSGRSPSGGSLVTFADAGQPSRRFEGHLDRPAVLLGRKHPQGVVPLVEREAVGEHAGQVDPPGLHQIEIVTDGVLADALDLLDPEGVGAHEGELLEVDGGVLPAARRVHPRLHERAPLGQHADPELEGLRPGHGVVDDVDAAGMGHRQSGERSVQDAARPLGQVPRSPPAGARGAAPGWRRTWWPARPGRGTGR